MANEYIITMTAANRIGILSAVTKAMEELGGDLRQASQTVVRGFFTMIFSAEFPEHLDPQVITDHLQDTCRPFGIDVNLKVPATERIECPDPVSAKLHSLRVGGDNQPGVLRELSSAISIRGIDIAGMHAIRARNGKGFEMVMKIVVPDGFSLQSLLDDLNRLGRSFNITADISDYS
ncbi:MAG: ACT domain-containing protein [Fuerstiella sp.]|nr:ACT domain-containing protein [Fuerstiella sp.]MCP4508254.1 ACT domain-containing protein [Fuerstiella sp.]